MRNKHYSPEEIIHKLDETKILLSQGHTVKAVVPKLEIAELHNDALPFYAERALDVDAVLTDTGREVCGTAAHPYGLYLDLNDIEHRRTQVSSPQTNGFVERFHRTVKEEFLAVAFR